MILAMFIVGLLITYLSIGLVSGRTYYVLKLKNWHNTKGINYKTKNQIKQEEELAKLEAKDKYDRTIQDQKDKRKSLVNTLAAATSKYEELQQQRLEGIEMELGKC